MTKTAILMAGAPASGKSYYIKHHIDKNYTIINIDDIMEEMSKRDGFTMDQMDANAVDKSKFAKALKEATKRIKEEKIPQAIRNNESFILDGMSSSLTQTMNLKTQLEEAGYTVTMVHMITSLKTALTRNEQRTGRRVRTSILERMWHIIQLNTEDYKRIFGAHYYQIKSGDEVAT